MPYRIKNGGDTRTVVFLAVFNKGETRDFTDDEIKSYEAISGIPFADGENLPSDFKVTEVKDTKSETKAETKSANTNTPKEG
jgi:hypothetical protein